MPRRSRSPPRRESPPRRRKRTHNAWDQPPTAEQAAAQAAAAAASVIGLDPSNPNTIHAYNSLAVANPERLMSIAAAADPAVAQSIVMSHLHQANLVM